MARNPLSVGPVRFHCVTTMNENGWKESGERMVLSFLQFWPEEAKPLVVYAEDFTPPAMDGIEVRKLPEWLDRFKAKYGKMPAATGYRPGRYDYRFDAIKFSHKVAALTDFGMDLTDGVMIVMDADTLTHSPVTVAWLEGLFPEPAYLAWLDRENAHPECGFVMYRCGHPYHRQFMESFRAYYTSGELFKLKETHDSFVLQQLVTHKIIAKKIPRPVSLSGDKRWHHPFVNGPLGACMDHLKGPGRKAQGKSNRRDMRNQRPELYWRGAV